MGIASTMSKRRVWGFRIKGQTESNDEGYPLRPAVEDYKEGYISIGFKLKNLPDPKVLKDESSKFSRNSGTMIRTFVESPDVRDPVRIGDIVLLKRDGKKELAIGEITGKAKTWHTPYDHHVARGVRWLKKDYPANYLLGQSYFAPRTITRKKALEDSYFIEQLMKGKPLSLPAIDIDDLPEAVKKLEERFSFLLPSYFEDLVECLLSAQGFEIDPNYRAGRVDVGIDAYAKRRRTPWLDEEYQIEDLYVQVKHKKITPAERDKLGNRINLGKKEKGILVTSKDKGKLENTREVVIVNGEMVAKACIKFRYQIPFKLASILQLYSKSGKTFIR